MNRKEYVKIAQDKLRNTDDVDYLNEIFNNGFREHDHRGTITIHYKGARIKEHILVWRISNNGVIPDGFILHKDGNRYNNDYSNLEVVDKYYFYSIQKLNSKVKDKDVRELLDKGETVRAIAKKFNCTHGLIEARKTKMNYNSFKTKICIVCGKEFSTRKTRQQVCSSDECQQTRKMNLYYDTTDPIKRKSKMVGSSIRLGKNKSSIIYDMIKTSVGKYCTYCGSILTLENISIDHKEPRNNEKVRKHLYTKAELDYYDRKENLEIICKKCNSLKGDFDYRDFKKLCDFLDMNPTIKIKLIKRLNLVNLKRTH